MRIFIRTGVKPWNLFFRFYICCDKCQDWFHGRCVGILQSEADNIDEYVCPNCQRNSSVNFANMKNLNMKDLELLKKLIKQIQVKSKVLTVPLFCIKNIKSIISDFQKIVIFI